MQKLVDRSAPTRQAITADTTTAKLADLWLSYLRDEGRIESTTINEYERVLTGVVVSELGGLRLCQATTSRISLFLVRVRTWSVNRQRKAKVVLGAMIDLAVRQDALPLNPVRQTSRVRRTKTETRSLTVEDLATARAAVIAWMANDRPGPKPTSDMADVIDLMLATGPESVKSSHSAGATSTWTPRGRTSPSTAPSRPSPAKARTARRRRSRRPAFGLSCCRTPRFKRAVGVENQRA